MDDFADKQDLLFRKILNNRHFLITRIEFVVKSCIDIKNDNVSRITKEEEDCMRNYCDLLTAKNKK